jgi:hypothetical protein
VDDLFGRGAQTKFKPLFRKRRIEMDQTTIIRVVCGVLFAIVLGVLIQRRRTHVK